MKPECETKGRLLRVAIELVWENGYGAVSVDEICRRAEVRKGSFYHFFPSKSDLAVAALEEDWREKAAHLDGVFSPVFPPLERLRRYAVSVRENQEIKRKKCGKVCGCPNLTLGSELSTQDENIRRKISEIMDRYQRYFESAIKEASAEGTVSPKNASAAAGELFAFSQGLLLQARIRNSLAPLLGLEAGFFRLLGLPPE